MEKFRLSSFDGRFPADRVSFEPSGADEVIVRLRGEYDHCTVALLSDVLVELMVLDTADVVLDVSEVTFIGSATVVLLDRAAGFLARRSRRLVLRSPSSYGRRVLEVCGVGYLIERALEPAGPAVDTTRDRSAAALDHRHGAAPLPISA